MTGEPKSTGALVARSASSGRLTGMAYKGTAEQRRAALQKGLKDAKRPKRRRHPWCLFAPAHRAAETAPEDTP